MFVVDETHRKEEHPQAERSSGDEWLSDLPEQASGREICYSFFCGIVMVSRKEKYMKKDHHHRPGTPLCSCGNRSCEVMEIVRLIVETGDNLALLHCDLHTLEQALVPMLEKMHEDQLSSLERWRLEQDIYRSQMASLVRPTMQWQQFSSLEEELSRRTQWVQTWYQQEREHLQHRREHLQEVVHQHEAFLEECALRFVHQALLPACVPGIAAVLQEHRERSRDRLSRVSREAEAQAQHVAALNAGYQAETQRLQAGQQGSEALLAFEQREETVQWVVKNLFGIGRPQSLSLTNRTFQHLKASQQWQTHLALQRHFFHYCEQVWRACEQTGLPAKVRTLTSRVHQWDSLWQHFATNPDPGTIQTMLLTSVGSH